jgi:hypothetical protein
LPFSGGRRYHGGVVVGIATDGALWSAPAGGTQIAAPERPPLKAVNPGKERTRGLL